jgi:hypothetical protein
MVFRFHLLTLVAMASPIIVRIVTYRVRRAWTAGKFRQAHDKPHPKDRANLLKFGR